MLNFLNKSKLALGWTTEKLPITGVAAPISETKASLTIQSALRLEAKALGTLGNAVTVKAEANTSDNLAVSVTGNDLTILLANATGSKNTMTLIAAAIAASTPANALVNAIVITGATQMTAFTVQSLTNGTNGTIGYLYQVMQDTNKNRWELKHIENGCYYWSPDGFPALNTEYVDRVESGVVIWKYRFFYGSLPNNAIAVKSHTISYMSGIVDWSYNIRLASTKLITLNGLSTTAIGDQITVSLSGGTGASIRAAIDRTAYEAYFNIYYTK